ncbi:MAG: hypothetical protein ACODAJ_05935 [Planctomycetota bacterium]
MEQRQRRNEDEATRDDAGAPASGDQQDWAEEGDAFLAAGEDAIRRALSTDATTFLRATRQQGGE